jgi:hypothetical protein
MPRSRGCNSLISSFGRNSSALWMSRNVARCAGVDFRGRLRERGRLGTPPRLQVHGKGTGSLVRQNDSGFARDQQLDGRASERRCVER